MTVTLRGVKHNDATRILDKPPKFHSLLLWCGQLSVHRNFLSLISLAPAPPDHIRPVHAWIPRATPPNSRQADSRSLVKVLTLYWGCSLPSHAERIPKMCISLTDHCAAKKKRRQWTNKKMEAAIQAVKNFLRIKLPTYRASHTSRWRKWVNPGPSLLLKRKQRYLPISFRRHLCTS